MRLTILWRGRPLIAVDLVDEPPAPAPEPAPATIVGQPPADVTLAEPTRPDTGVGFTQR